VFFVTTNYNRTKYIRLATQNITDNTEAEWFEFVLKELEGRRFDYSSSVVQWLGTFSCDGRIITFLKNFPSAQSFLPWPNGLSKKFPIGSIFPQHLILSNHKEFFKGSLTLFTRSDPSRFIRSKILGSCLCVATGDKFFLH